ncbi:MAG: tetratricopeptide repeat protein, partial [Myxococcales bacterium]|nr:tetratricopeptide repeat protein [Myxococcales bacterium]
PAYMAPEQHLGRSTDARTDQFGFCVALWEAFYGRRPFAGETMLEIVDNVCNHRLVEPPRTSDVPGWLRAVLVRGLSPEVGDRWPSMDALLTALATDPTRARRWRLGALAATTVVSLGLFGGYMQRESRREEAEAKAAAEADARARRCAGEANRVKEVWNESTRERAEKAFLATGHPLAEGTWKRTAALLDEYAESWAVTREATCLAAELNPTEPVAGQPDSAELTRLCLDESLASLNFLVTALGETKTGNVLRAQSGAAGLPVVSECTDPHSLSVSMHLPEDPGIQARVAAARRRLIEVEALHSLGNSEAAREEARAVLVEAEGINWPPLTADAQFWVGWLDVSLGEFAAAQPHLEQALFIGGEARDPIAVRAAASLVYLAGDKRRAFDEALLWGRLGQLLLGYTEGNVSLAQAKLLTDLGTVHAQRGEHKEAIDHFRRALHIYEEQLPPEHPDLAFSLNNLGMAYLDSGDAGQALAFHRRALDIRTRSLPPKHPDLGYTYVNIGLVHARQQANSEALADFRAALSIWEANYPPQHPSISFTLMAMGEVYEAMGNHGEAAKQFERVLELRESSKTALAVDLAQTRIALARVYWAQGKRKDASALALTARDGYEGAGDAKHLAEVEAWLRERDIHAEPLQPGPLQPDQG